MKLKLTKNNLHFFSECIKIETISSSLNILNESNIKSILEMEDKYIVEKYLNEIAGSSAVIAPIISGLGVLVVNNIGKVSVALLAALTAMLGSKTDMAIKHSQASRELAMKSAMGESAVLKEEVDKELVKDSLEIIKEIKNTTLSNKSEFEKFVRSGEYKKAIPYLKGMIKDLSTLIGIKSRNNIPLTIEIPRELLSTSMMWLSLAVVGVVSAKLLVPVGRRILRFFSGKSPEEETKKFASKAKDYLKNVKEKTS